MKEIIYIGTYDKQIYIANFENERLTITNQSETIINPSYLHINKDVLYAVSETKIGSMQAFNIKGKKLELLSSKVINQELPCHITSDIDRKRLLVSSYGSGSLVMYNLKKNGAIDEIVNKTQYDNSHMHYSTFIEKNVYAVDLGNDEICIFDTKMNLISKIYIKKGAGPRHLAFTKDSKRLIILTEISNELLVYEKQDNGVFKLVQQLSIFQKQEVESYAGAIKISNNDKNIYVTNRGHNSISVFKEINNKYELIQNISCFGEFPRDFSFNKTEEYAFVANQKSNNVSVFKINKDDGMLTRIKDAEVRLKSPACIVRRDYEI